MSLKTKQTTLLIFLFIIMNTAIYFVTKINTQEKIDLALKSNLSILQTHYKLLLESQKNIAYTSYKSILRNTDVINLLENSYNQRG